MTERGGFRGYAVILSVSDSEERTPSDSDGAVRRVRRNGILSGDHREPTARIAWERERLHLTVAYSFSYYGRGTIPPSPLYTRGAFSRVPRPLDFRGRRYEIP